MSNATVFWSSAFIGGLGIVSLVLLRIASNRFEQSITMLSNALQLMDNPKIDVEKNPWYNDFVMKIQEREFGKAIRLVLEKSHEHNGLFKTGLVLEEIVTPLGLAGTVLGILQTFAGTTSQTRIEELYPNLAMAILTTLAGVLSFITIKVLAERPALDSYGRMQDFASSLVEQLQKGCIKSDTTNNELDESQTQEVSR